MSGIEAQIEQYFENQIISFPEAADAYASIAGDYNKKLFHQLTGRLLSLINTPHFSSQSNLLNLYQNLVKYIETDIKPLDLILFCVAASKQQPDAAAAFAFLDSLQAKVASDVDATLLCRVEAALWKLRGGDSKACLATLEKAHAQADSALGVDARVHAHLHCASMEYHKKHGSASQYFRHALSYLGYVKSTSMAPGTDTERVALASEIALAAVVGDDVFSFGELLQHDMMSWLQGSTQSAWLAPLLIAFSVGDINAFEQIVQQHQLPVLATNATWLQQKIRLMALVELIFRRPSEDRCLSFDLVAQHCHVALNDVEPLLMKAMSRSLIRAVIDQVTSTVRVSWAQPRVLDHAQIVQLRDRMQNWAQHIDQTSIMLEGEAPELFL